MYIEVWLSDQNSKPLEIEDKVDITLLINSRITYKKWLIIQLNIKIEYRILITDFYLLLKPMSKSIGKDISKTLRVITARNLMIILKYLLQMHLKLL